MLWKTNQRFPEMPSSNLNEVARAYRFCPLDLFLTVYLREVIPAWCNLEAKASCNRSGLVLLAAWPCYWVFVWLCQLQCVATVGKFSANPSMETHRVLEQDGCSPVSKFLLSKWHEGTWRPWRHSLAEVCSLTQLTDTGFAWGMELSITIP